ncbi:zona pellucida sperm-binding protein 3-like, partial [Rhinoraja longicauda]
CGERSLVVTVYKDLFGTRHLVKAADLTLGPAGCPATNVFTANSTMAGDFLIYTTRINYVPWALGVIIVRTNEVIVPIQCRYPRMKGNVSSDPIKPTWILFSSTKSGEGRLSFSLRLMNDDWLTERTSATYYLGELIHMEA